MAAKDIHLMAWEGVVVETDALFDQAMDSGCCCARIHDSLSY